MSEIVARAFSVLNLIATAEKPLRLMEIVARLDLDKSAAHRLLSFLESNEWVQRDKESLQYRVGPALLTLSAAAVTRADLVNVARPYFAELRDLSGETVSLHLKVGHGRICLGGLESRQEVRNVIPPGVQRALFEGITGKAMLAFLTTNEAEDIIGRARRADIDLKALDTQLRRARASGGLWDVSDVLPDACVLSAPIFDSASVKGALTISGPSRRWTRQKCQQIFPRLRDVTQKIGESFGARNHAEAVIVSSNLKS